MQSGPITLWAALKARYWSRIEGNGSYTSQGLNFGVATDNGYQEQAFDATGVNANGTLNPSSGNIVNVMIASDGTGRTALNNPNGTVIGGSVATPATPTLVPSSTSGSTTWAYETVYRFSSGVTSIASAAVTATTGAATLTAAAPNVLSGAVPQGVAYIDIYRTTAGGTPSTTGQIGSVTCNTLPASGAWSFNDTGIAGDGTSPPTTNTSGFLKINTGVFDFTIAQLAIPTVGTITHIGTAGSTSYTYEVAAVTATGSQAVSATANTATGNATLTAANANVIPFKASPGAVSYNVYRTASSGTPSGTGLIGTVAIGSPPSGTYTFTDTGIVATGTAPTASSNNTGGIVASGGGVGASNYVSVNLTAAQIIASFATPTSVIAAPGAGKALLVQQILFEMTPSSTAFTAGDPASFVYHGGSVATHAGSIPAATITAAPGVTNTLLGPAVADDGTVVPANTGIDFSVATQAFATGTGTAKVQIWYNVVTL